MTQSAARILVVDDEDDLRMLLSQIVSGAGHVVTTAGDGEEAISLLKDNVFDLALLDIQMPKVNGIGVLKYIHSNCPKTKVIILTGYADLSYAMEAKEYGAQDFINKPYRLEEIIDTIDHALAG